MWESKEAGELWERVKQLPLSDRLGLLVLLASSVQQTIEKPKYEARIVADAIAHVKGNVLSSQVDLQGSHSKNGFIDVIVSCEVEQQALQRLLYDLEAGMPFLFIDQFVAQAPVAA